VNLHQLCWEILDLQVKFSLHRQNERPPLCDGRLGFFSLCLPHCLRWSYNLKKKKKKHISHQFKSRSHQSGSIPSGSGRNKRHRLTEPDTGCVFTSSKSCRDQIMGDSLRWQSDGREFWVDGSQLSDRCGSHGKSARWEFWPVIEMRLKL